VNIKHRIGCRLCATITIDNNHLSKLSCLKARCQGCWCDESANGEITTRLKRSPGGSKVHEIMAIYDVDRTRKLRAAREH